MADIDWSATEQTLKDEASKRGLAYDPSDLADVQRNASYAQNADVDPSKYLDVAVAKYDARANNAPNEEGKDWGTATNMAGTGPAQTDFTVNSNGSLKATATAPNFRLPTLSAPKLSTSNLSTPGQYLGTSPTPSGTTRTPFSVDPYQDSTAGLANPESRSPQLNQALQQIAIAYKTYLGGQGTLQEYLSQLGGGQNLSQQSITYAINQIANSPEAKAYAAWKAANPAGAAPAAAPAAPSPTGAAGPITPTGTSGGASGTGNTNPSYRPNTSPIFTDPGQRLVEDNALARMQQLNNPDPSSGTAMYEAYAKQLVDMLKAPPYTAGDEATIKAQAYDSISNDEASTQQQWLEEMSRRGIPASSGIALQGLQNIKNQFNQLRAQVDQQFAQQAIGLGQQNRMSVLDVLGSLSTSENSRLNLAQQYATIPYNLEQDAFGRDVSAVGAGGSPTANVQTAIALMTAIQNSQTLSSEQKAQAAQELLAVIGGL